MSTELLTTAVDCFWLFFGGVLVFFMQTGFTMVEAGFTRSKNTGNIIMKNIVDFMFGSIIYWFIGYGLMYGEGNGFIGIPFGDMFMNGMAGAENMDYTALFFQTVFCATSATIVSTETIFSSLSRISSVLFIGVQTNTRAHSLSLFGSFVTSTA